MTKSDSKVALITGSATGVGAATAILLAQKGCNVVINYTRSKDDAEATAGTCRGHGVEAITVQADVGENDDCKRMVQETMDKWGRIDYLINNAARTKYNPYPNLEGVTSDDFLAMYKVNVVGVYQMVSAVTPIMKAQGEGAVAITSSIGGVTGIASSIPYAASKAALNLMAKSLAHVLAPEIRINTVVPGPIQTRWLKGGLGEDAYDGFIKSMEEQLPLRKVATPEDVAEALVWFCEGASCVTGETLILDSGIHIGKLPAYSGGDD
jgi:3-oxoacyl-[acyl-carrier protein] reductase